MYLSIWLSQIYIKVSDETVPIYIYTPTHYTHLVKRYFLQHLSIVISTTFRPLLILPFPFTKSW